MKAANRSAARPVAWLSAERRMIDNLSQEDGPRLQVDGKLPADVVPVQREEERARSPLMSIPPLRGGDFQGIRVYRSDVFLGRARKANFRAQQHRLDEPTKLSLGMGASLQSPLPFRLARSL